MAHSKASLSEICFKNSNNFSLIRPGRIAEVELEGPNVDSGMVIVQNGPENPAALFGYINVEIDGISVENANSCGEVMNGQYVRRDQNPPFLSYLSYYIMFPENQRRFR